MGLYRILSGKICNGYLEVRTPKVADLLDAEIYAEGEYDKAFADGLYTTEEMVSLLIERNLLKTDYLEQQKALLKHLDKVKIEYYESFYRSSKDAFLHSIQEINQELSLLLISYKQYEKFTCSGVKEEAKEDALLHKTTFYQTGEIYDWGRVSLDQLKVWLSGQKLDESEVREIARSREWLSIWNAQQSSPFLSEELGWSPEYRELVYWTQLYQSIAESGSMVDENILRDDYALDGFLLKERQKSVSSSQQRKIDVKGQEVFIAPSAGRSSADIYDLNDDQGRKLTRQSRIMTGD